MLSSIVMPVRLRPVSYLLPPASCAVMLPSEVMLDSTNVGQDVNLDIVEGISTQTGIIWRFACSQTSMINELAIHVRQLISLPHPLYSQRYCHLLLAILIPKYSLYSSNLLPVR